MARQTKPGLIYYNMDTDRYSDIRIKRLKSKFKANGIAIYDYILCEIYRVNGYYINLNEDIIFNISDYFGIDEKIVNEVIIYCSEIGLFDNNILDKNQKLTSKSIQNRYIFICKSSKRKIILDKNIILNSDNKPLNSEDKPYTPELSEDSTQSKVNESKVNEIKEDNKNEDFFLIPSMANLFYEENPNYSKSQNEDFTALKEIAEFFCENKYQTKNFTSRLEVDQKDILNDFKKISSWYKEKKETMALNLIVKFKRLQTILNEIKTKKNGTGIKTTFGENNTIFDNP